MEKKTRIIRFLTDKLSIFTYLEGITDIRRFPTIPLRTILLSLLLMPIYSLSSLLSLDSWARKGGTRRVFACKRKMIASDSTFARVLRWLSPEQLRRLLLLPLPFFSHHQLLCRALVENGRSYRLAIMDGTFVSGHWILYFLLYGQIRYTVEVLPLRSRGEELSAAKALIPQLPELLGALMPQLLLVDMLYFAQNLFTCAREAGMEVLTKFDEADLREVSRDAQNLFRHFGADTQAEGYDRERLCRYSINVTRDEYYGFAVQVAEVSEHYSKRKAETAEVHFWIVTTALELSPEEMREAAHLRWQIENNQFRRQNFLCATKHGYTRHQREFVNLLLLVSLSMAVTDALQVLLAAHPKIATRFLEGRKPTWRGWCEALSEHFPQGLFALPP